MLEIVLQSNFQVRLMLNIFAFGIRGVVMWDMFKRF